MYNLNFTKNIIQTFLTAAKQLPAGWRRQETGSVEHSVIKEQQSLIRSLFLIKLSNLFSVHTSTNIQIYSYGLSLIGILSLTNTMFLEMKFAIGFLVLTSHTPTCGLRQALSPWNGWSPRTPGVEAAWTQMHSLQLNKTFVT